jgi:retinol dehydrogenase 12
MVPLLITFAVIPWGRLSSLRKDIDAAGKMEEEGGTAIASKFWDWSDEQVKQYI